MLFIPAQLATCCCTQLESALKRVPVDYAEHIATVFKGCRDLRALSFADQQQIAQMLVQLYQDFGTSLQIALTLGIHRSDVVSSTRSLEKNGVSFSFKEVSSLSVRQHTVHEKLREHFDAYGSVNSLEEFIQVLESLRI